MVVDRAASRRISPPWVHDVLWPGNSRPARLSRVGEDLRIGRLREHLLGGLAGFRAWLRRAPRSIQHAARRSRAAHSARALATLGHSTVAFTMDVYAVVAEELAEAAATAIAAFIARRASNVPAAEANEG
jgi:hypothetical protein